MARILSGIGLEVLSVLEAPTPRYLVLYEDAGETIIYSIAANGSKIAEIARGPLSDTIGHIHASDGSYLGWDTSLSAVTDYRAYNATTDTTDTLAVTGGRIGSAASVADGRIRWFEYQVTTATSTTIWAMSADLDLTDVQTVSSQSVSAFAGGGTWLSVIDGPHFSDNAQRARVTYQAEVSTSVAAYHAYDGGIEDNTTSSPGGDPTAPNAAGRPDGLAGSIAPHIVLGTAASCNVTDSADAYATTPVALGGFNPLLDLQPDSVGNYAVLIAGGDGTIREVTNIGVTAAGPVSLPSSGVDGSPHRIFPLY